MNSLYIHVYTDEDMYGTIARALHSNLDHWGIIVSKRVPIGEIVKRMLNLLNSLTADEMQNRLEYLTDWPPTS